MQSRSEYLRLLSESAAPTWRISVLDFLTDSICGRILPVVIFAAGIYHIIILGLFPITKLKTISAALFKNKKRGNSSAKAMCVALAGTLGVGNIAGVAGAIAIGGAGTVFWMWLSAFAAMLLKYSETVLAVKYRKLIDDGAKRRYTGGAFMYMSAHGDRLLGICFAVLCIITSISMGSVVQVGVMTDAAEKCFGFPKFAVAGVFALLAFIILSGGFSRVSELTFVAVPVFCALYVGVSLYIIISDFSRLPAVFSEIFSGAFSLRAFGGGTLGYAWLEALRLGVVRGILSNEAGSGTSPTAHAAADTDSPCEQGFFGILEVFVDTIVLCSMTAFVVLLSGVSNEGGSAMTVAVNAYAHYIGRVAPPLLTIAVVFFAFGTILCWAVYGIEAVRFLGTCSIGVGNMPDAKVGKVIFIYIAIYSSSVFAAAFVGEGVMWDIADLSVAVMTVINSVYLVTLGRETAKDTKAYFSRRT